MAKKKRALEKIIGRLHEPFATENL